MSESSLDQWRAVFDIEITFSNGGGLSAEGFRVDVPTEQVDDATVANLFVRQLGLTMVGGADVANLRVIREAHKNPASTPKAPGTRRRTVELSHPIRDGLITYPGLPAPHIEDHLSWAASHASYGPGTEFQIGRIEMVANTGTYLDTPAHRHRDGADLSGVGLDRLADLPGLLVRVTGAAARAIDAAAFAPFDLAGRAVLVETGWSGHFGTEAYGTGHPYLTAAAADFLVQQGAVLVGIDSLNIDDTADLARPAHTALLSAGIPIVEHLRGLDQLPVDGFRFTAAPPLIEGMGTFPVRAFATIDE
ncbi:cyclase family protein [Kitasatospora sp. NPDC002040]|uniref:cyclase family protein n=1 Tax=Kitasatospora sp. NPDC002040 TaxID=3154661 RepID=UPI00331F0449